MKVHRWRGISQAVVLASVAVLGIVVAARMQRWPKDSDPEQSQVVAGPLLLVTNGRENFGRYYTEILRTEGFNAFTVADASDLDEALLDDYDLVILAKIPLSTAQVAALTQWVSDGGNLIAMDPHPNLDGLLGIVRTGSTLSEGYLRIDSRTTTGRGIHDETMQFHGVAQLVVADDAATLATLYSTATTTTGHPAVTLRSVGSRGGQAAAFLYDLATSIVYTRQGNPEWAGQERDGFAPIRANDMFYGAAETGSNADWVDFDKIAVPQADEQQRFLANLIIEMSADRKPLPRFWYFPHGHKAAVVMTGDDHANNGTTARFEQFMAASAPDCSVEDWECVRATSYMFPSTPMSATEARRFEAAGFELGLHVNTRCDDYTRWQLERFYLVQIVKFQMKFPGLSPLRTQRHHCIAFSDWATAVKVQSKYGMRLDTNYYYWPPEWVADRPGHFTGSAMPMRFADLDGSLIDVYQVVTQMTDESGQRYPFTIDTLLDRALGEEEQYGVYTINAHTDEGRTVESDAVLAAALSRGVPIVSARQMLEWLDARNGSTFTEVSWQDDVLRFNVSAAPGARGLRTLLPYTAADRVLSAIQRDGADVAFERVTVKGLDYAAFASPDGTYTAIYRVEPKLIH